MPHCIGTLLQPALSVPIQPFAQRLSVVTGLTLVRPEKPQQPSGAYRQREKTDDSRPVHGSD